MKNNALWYAKAVQEKCGELRIVIEFVDGTVLGVVHTSGSHIVLLVVCYEHKRKHGIKFLLISGPEKMVLHCCDLMKGVRHDWKLYSRLNMDKGLEETASIHGRQFCMHEDF